MREMTATRRMVLQAATAGMAGVLLHDSRATGQPGPALRIEEPVHGAVLNRRHGERVEGGLKIRVCGQAPARDAVTVNGALSTVSAPFT